MNNKDSFSKRAGNFFAGKGFYIVLILCVAVIGASAWAMLAHQNKVDTEDLDLYLAESAVTPMPTANQPPVREDRPTMLETEDDDAEEEWKAEEEQQASEEDDAELTEETEAETLEETPAEAEEEQAETQDEAAADTMQVPTSYVWPISGEVAVPHKVDELIYDKTMADWRTHSGIDITAERGDKIMAVAPGTVERIYEDDLYGTTVVIDHGGEIRSVYANLADTPVVSEGEQVIGGQDVGAVGDTALVETGIVSHLHFELIVNGERVDPIAYLPER